MSEPLNCHMHRHAHRQRERHLSILTHPDTITRLILKAAHTT
ncbi:hypothetical protein [Streptomyces lunaelactis]|nr:hypothetical protein [Streptomyces lunaelactis]